MSDTEDMQTAAPQGLHAGLPSGLQISKGQVFPDRRSCTAFVQDLALRQGRRAVVDTSKSGGRNIAYACSSETPCTFKVIAYKSRKQDVNGFFISSFELEHNGCTGSGRVTSRQVSQLSVAKAAVGSSSRTPGRALQSQVMASTSLSVSDRMIFRVRDKIVADLFGDYEAEFKLLPSLLEEFCRINPTSRFCFESNKEGQFDLAFLSHPYVNRHQEYGQVVLGVDGAFMKHGVYSETMLVLVGRDGANHNINLAIALCASEDSRNCSWFFDNCQHAGINFNNVPVFSDRGRGLIFAARQPSRGAIVRFCTRHIISNIRGAFKKNIPGDMELVMYRLQAAETEEAFIGILATLASTHPKIAEYIQTIRPEYWTMHPAAVHHVKMYGWRTTNFVESTNGAAVPARHKFPFQFFKDFMEQFMRNAYKAQVSSDKWIDQGLIVTPYANKMIEEQRTAAGFHTVLPSTQGKAFVRDTRGNFGQHRVNIEEKICTCSYMRQFGLPCRHYIAALIKFKSLSKLYDACDACYFVKGYAAGYGCGTDQGIELVQETALSARDILPPERTQISSGRKRTKRMASQGETPNSATAKPPRHCTICGEAGHNRRTCDSI